MILFGDFLNMIFWSMFCAPGVMELRSQKNLHSDFWFPDIDWTEYVQSALWFKRFAFL